MFSGYTKVAGELAKLNMFIELSGVDKHDPGINTMRTLIECGCPFDAIMKFGERMNEEGAKGFKVSFTL